MDVIHTFAQIDFIMMTHRCPNIEEFKAILKKHSLKATPQRLAVHEAMMSLGHASADMVTELITRKASSKVRERFPKTALSAIFIRVWNFVTRSAMPIACLPMVSLHLPTIPLNMSGSSLRCQLFPWLFTVTGSIAV
jgi:hypothetical protein